jgi:hypothetical protein
MHRDRTKEKRNVVKTGNAGNKKKASPFSSALFFRWQMVVEMEGGTARLEHVKQSERQRGDRLIALHSTKITH